jgi:TolB protein
MACRRATVVAGFVTLVLVMAAVACGSLCAVARADTEHSDLWVLGLFASTSHRVTTGNDPYAFALDPSWSPDGRRIAFVYGVCDDCSGDIITIDADGRHRREYTAAVGTRPAWSPDGRTVTYVTAGQSLASLDLRSGRTTPLVAAGRTALDYPAWSPDGSRLAFAREVQPDNWDIFVYAPTTGRTERLVHAARSDIEPVWSRDGRWIAYVSQLPNLRFAVSLIRSNGTGGHVLTHGGGGAQDPSWSPDGRSLSFVGSRPGRPAALWAINVNGRLARQLTPPDLTVISASWAPTGDRIVYAAR